MGAPATTYLDSLLSLQIASGGVVQPSRGTLNIIGGGTITDNPANNSHDLTITASTSTPLFVSALLATPGSGRQVIFLDGYSAVGDGGGGLFAWDAASTATPDGGTIFLVTGVATGRWKRIYSGSYNLAHFGAAANDATKAVANLAAYNAAIAAMDASGGGTLYFPSGQTYFSGTLGMGTVGKTFDGSPGTTTSQGPVGDPQWLPGAAAFSGSILRWTNPCDGIRATQYVITSRIKNISLVGCAVGNVTVGWTQPAIGSSVNLTVLASTVASLIAFGLVGQSIWIDGCSTPVTPGSTLSYPGGRYTLNSASGTTINVTNTGDVYNAPAGATVNALAGTAGISLLTRGISSTSPTDFLTCENVGIYNFWEGLNPGANENFRHIDCDIRGNSVGVMIDGKPASVTQTIATPTTTNSASFTQPAPGGSVGPITVGTTVGMSSRVVVVAPSGAFVGRYEVVVNSGTTCTLKLNNARYSLGTGATVPAGCKIGTAQGTTNSTFAHTNVTANGEGIVLETTQAVGYDGGLVQGNRRAGLLIVGGAASGPITFGGTTTTWFEANGYLGGAPGTGPSIAIDMTEGPPFGATFVNLHQGGDTIGFMCVAAANQSVPLNFFYCGFGGQITIPAGAIGGSWGGAVNGGAYINLAKNGGAFNVFGTSNTGTPARFVAVDNIATVGAGTTNALNCSMGVVSAGRNTGFYDVIATGHTAAGDVCNIQMRQPFTYVAGTMHFGTPVTLVANSGAGPSGPSTVITGASLAFIGVGGPGIAPALTGVAGQNITWYVEATGVFNPN